MTKHRYDHKEIEAKWQEFWEKNRSFRTREESDRPAYYVLDMFPYPSGSGLHVGHVVGYTATDIVARFKRMQGFDLLHPMGWDSFGLPAEQYAIRTKTHPAETTKANITTYKRQLKSLGLSYDWEREIATSDPSYYKWTQWIFTKLYERGLAYESEMLVNYCPDLGTVLANEEIENGLSKEGGHPIERRPLRQWMLKITAYADRLLDDLDLVDWPESIKKLQANWIGRREGHEILFTLESGDTCAVFTNRADTLFGVTYLVLAPENALVEKITKAECKQAVSQYRAETAKKSDLTRTELATVKTGVFTGAYALHPATNERLPIWIGDYVLNSYGTGAVMGVPAHDERDFEYAIRFSLPIKPVIHPIASPGEAPLSSSTVAQVLAGKLCWGEEGTCIGSSADGLILNGLSPEGARRKVGEWLLAVGKGGPKVNYKLRDWLFSRQRYWGEPIPILHFEDGTKRALSLDELPLLPPQVEEYRPTPEGLSPIAAVKEWVEIVDPKTGKRARRETNTMPQWAGSCWYYLRFCDPQNKEAAWSADKERRYLPVDLYVGGAEHAVLHLLYARFWHKVLFDCGLVSTKEPFAKLFNQGLVLHRSYRRTNGAYLTVDEVTHEGERYIYTKTGEEVHSQIEKMSKSKLNVVTPDEVIAEYGADALRLYEMFMGPLEKEKPWNTDGVTGCYRFLTRFYDLATSDKVTDVEDRRATRFAARLVDYVGRAIETLQFNTAIAKMMEFINDFSKLETYPRASLVMATQAIAPFAPHLAEEVWQLLGQTAPLIDAPWPAVRPEDLYDESATYVVQVNGKMRGRFELPKDQSKERIIELAKKDPNISRHLEGRIESVVFVPNRLLNFVVKP